MTESERDVLLRRYAAGDIAWAALRDIGFDNYLDVLTGLGEACGRPLRPWTDRCARPARRDERSSEKRAGEALACLAMPGVPVIIPRGSGPRKS